MFHVSSVEGAEDDAVRADPALCYGAEDPEQVVLVPWGSFHSLDKSRTSSNMKLRISKKKHIFGFGAIHL